MITITDITENMASMNKKKGISKTLSIGIVVVAFVLCGVGLWYAKGMQTQKPIEKQEVEQGYKSVEVDGKSYLYNSDIVGILLLGVDSSDSSNLGQSDFVSMLLMDRKEKQMKILSISRDTMTPIHLYDASGNDLGWEKQHLALAYAYGNNKEHASLLSCEAVSKLLNDIPVVNFVSTDVSSIADFQDVVGELEVVMPNDSLSYLQIGWDQGAKITLNKENAETFVRSRDTKESFSNEKRRERQKVYMDAYITKLKEMLSTNYSATLNKLTSVYGKVTSNLSLDELDAYAQMIMTYSMSENSFYNLPGLEKQGEFHDEYQIDELAKDKMILQLFYKER